MYTCIYCIFLFDVTQIFKPSLDKKAGNLLNNMTIELQKAAVDSWSFCIQNPLSETMLACLRMLKTLRMKSGGQTDSLGNHSLLTSRCSSLIQSDCPVKY